mmetsp:Transcript_15052/g.60452  ORF Transcript_15052/g.60452 Transcript_15052/m.60452 type:complete len:275 (-) Transcript_15052:1-825(-)
MKETPRKKNRKKRGRPSQSHTTSLVILRQPDPRAVGGLPDVEGEQEEERGSQEARREHPPVVRREPRQRVPRVAVEVVAVEEEGDHRERVERVALLHDVLLGAVGRGEDGVRQRIALERERVEDHRVDIVPVARGRRALEQPATQLDRPEKQKEGRRDRRLDVWRRERRVREIVLRKLAAPLRRIEQLALGESVVGGVHGVVALGDRRRDHGARGERDGRPRVDHGVRDDARRDRERGARDGTRGGDEQGERARGHGLQVRCSVGETNLLTFSF